MADDVNHHATADVAAAPPAPARVEPVVDRRERARRTSYRRRFAILYAILGVLLVAALAAFAVLVVRDAPAEAGGWSEWQPEGNALERMQQIADRIPKAYVTPEHGALNIARARQLVAQVNENAIPVGAILIPSGGIGGEGGEPAVYDAAGAIGIALCGLGPQCSVPGEESSDAALALRRQAVELALYGFTYVDELEAVVVFMPPTRAGESGGAVFLRREDVREELRHPLDETLPVRAAQIMGEFDPHELAAVVRLTDSRLYEFSYEAAPDGSPILVLTPPG